jgi:hypothetical protein
VKRIPQILNAIARNESGATLAEFALVLPVFLLLIFGAIEGGMLMWQFQQGEIAAKRAVRIAVTRQLMVPNAMGDCGPSASPATTPAGTFCAQVPDTSVWATCKGDGSGGSVCGPGIARVAEEISRFYPAVKKEDISIQLSGGNLGFMGLGHPTPIVTVTFDKVNYEFIVLGGLGGLADFAMPKMTASAPAEDVWNGPGN